ncbi:MAG: 2-phosphotransferase, Tpt1 / KptA family protein [Phycisphaerales bacterium]|nr:2-phosphotransferase, Tpt1 / KptA family protein [Phycisphaerales bacterium]
MSEQSDTVDKHLKSKSKFLSLVLRHDPAAAGIALDAAGWVAVDALLTGCAAAGTPITRAQFDEIVRTNDKGRLAVSPDGARVRANQGHSVEVELGHVPVDPPAVLYHGTAVGSVPAIRAAGLLRQGRHHVHLADDPVAAAAVGGRHGKPVVLTVDAARMRADGHAFYLTPNGVWLADVVPAAYLTFPG